MVKSNIKASLPIWLLLLISFVEGGAVMIVELLGAKIIAPYYGTSLYVWSSVLSVTLGGLAAGYYSGGYISKKFPGSKSLFIVVIIASFFTAIAPWIAPGILLFTEPLGVRLGSLISVLFILFPSVLCFGMVSPMIIQLINKSKESAGKAAGTVYAISTVGGIAATLLAGFYLIPEWGIRTTSLVTAILLASIAIFYFIFMKKIILAVAAVFLFMLSFAFRTNEEGHNDIEVLYSSTGILGEWTVLDTKIKGKEHTHTERRLLLNGIDQSYTQLGYEPLSLWQYPHKLTAYSSMKPPGSKALLLGMGGGSIAYEMLEMGFDLDIVELDERVEFIAQKYFKYNPGSANLYIDDARHFIRNTKEKYDFVLMDLAIGEVQPSHIFTLEGFDDLKKILNDDAMLLVNFQGIMDSEKHGKGPKSVFLTLEKSGFYVDYYAKKINRIESDEPSLTNDIFILASLTKNDYKAMMSDLRYNDWFQYEKFSYENMIREDRPKLEGAYVLVDDKPRLEHLNTELILKWRKNKIVQNLNQMLKSGVSIYH